MGSAPQCPPVRVARRPDVGLEELKAKRLAFLWYHARRRSEGCERGSCRPARPVDQLRREGGALG
eukprot:7023980-Alexandrium_andersonii.AAC.1